MFGATTGRSSRGGCVNRDSTAHGNGSAVDANCDGRSGGGDIGAHLYPFAHRRAHSAADANFGTAGSVYCDDSAYPGGNPYAAGN
jgi:hypothetical protein